MFNYKTLQDTHDFFQQELDLAKSNLEKAKKSEALNFAGFIEPNEDVFKFYENTDNLYIEDLFYNNIENEQELLEEVINWLAEASKDLVKFNRFCLEAKENGDLKESIKLIDILTEADPKVGTGKKPKGSSRRLYTDENPKDTVHIKFKTTQDIKDTLSKASFKSKSHARKSQIINLIHQRVRAAYNRAKDHEVKARLKHALDYIEQRKEASKKKTQQLQKEASSFAQQAAIAIAKKKSGKYDKEGKRIKETSDPQSGKAAPYGSGYAPVKNKKLEEDTLNEKCWKGYTQKGMKTMFGKKYPNCIKNKK